MAIFFWYFENVKNRNQFFSSASYLFLVFGLVVFLVACYVTLYPALSIHRLVGRLVGWLVPILLFGIFVDMDESTNSLLSLRILLKSKIDVWAKYKYPISNINTSTHSIYVILGLIWLSWGQWRAEGKFWPRDSWFCLEKTYRCIFDLFWGLKKWSGWADLKLVEAGLVPGKADLEPWSS